MLSILVTGQPPNTEKNVYEPLLKLFQKYSQIKYGEEYFPFEHQAQAFQKVQEDQDVYLVAGTAAGKTLAIAIPLFYKLTTGRIRKILLMYPTIALLEDQRQVIDTLAEITHLEIGQVQGGMSRSTLIAALNKPVILSTPDEIYWFFRKNIKYNSLLIYALAIIDEYVLDEAHLFNGLMLWNFEHLWWRIKSLAKCIEKSPRLHILTATPTEDLKRLNNSQPILGKSKCHDVQVEFSPSGRFDLADQMVNAINEALTKGRHKILVVSNSARMAHQLFEKYHVKDISTIPAEHRLRFGRVKLKDLIRCLVDAGVSSELVEKVKDCLFREEDVVLEDIPHGMTINLPLEKVIPHISEILEHQCRQIKRVLWERTQHKEETWEILLKNRPLPCYILGVVRSHLENTTDLEKQKEIIDQWLDNISEKLANSNDDNVVCNSPEFEALSKMIISAGIESKLASLLTKRLKFEIKIDADQFPIRNLSHRTVYLHWLDWIVGKEEAAKLREIIKMELEQGKLKVECRHIGLWKDSFVPVIVYSGSMSKKAREGLIHVFSDLERAVLISTSAVEVGVDFDADTLITSECEGRSFLQRFGRVGRHGRDSKVFAFLSGDVYSSFNSLDKKEIKREDFSSRIIENFPRHNYVTGSQLLDASHYLINEQLGRIGEKLNAHPDLKSSKQLAEQIRKGDVQFGFGLRSTMPQITIGDGVTKDPFYLLRYVDNDKLRPTDSPFEVARAKVWFTEIIFKKAQFDIIVNLDETLKSSRHLFIYEKGRFFVQSKYGIGKQYVLQMGQYPGWHKWHPGTFILLGGDVYLDRIDKELSTSEPVQDDEGNRIFIPNQVYLVIWGWKDEKQTRELLQNAHVLDWEELYYDWERFKQNNPYAMVILEKNAGACFAAHKELLQYVSSRVQK